MKIKTKTTLNDFAAQIEQWRSGMYRLFGFRRGGRGDSRARIDDAIMVAYLYFSQRWLPLQIRRYGPSGPRVTRSLFAKKVKLSLIDIARKEKREPPLSPEQIQKVERNRATRGRKGAATFSSGEPDRRVPSWVHVNDVGRTRFHKVGCLCEDCRYFRKYVVVTRKGEAATLYRRLRAPYPVSASEERAYQLRWGERLGSPVEEVHNSYRLGPVSLSPA